MYSINCYLFNTVWGSGYTCGS